MVSIFLVGILGAFVSAITGTFWYFGNTPMGKWHMEYLGFDNLTQKEKERSIAEAKPNMWKLYLAQFILSFLTSFFIAFVTSYSVKNGAPASSVYYYIPMIWLAFTVPVIGQNLIWGKSTANLAWKKFLSDSLYNLITFLLVAFIATLFN